MSEKQHLSTWVPREIKGRFAELARLQGRSESALLKSMVEAMIATATPPTDPTLVPEPAPSSRLSVRLRDAVKKFVATEFGSKHRHAMVLHTDEPHPHVHLILKARSEEEERLHIKKGTLRHWREKFAENLRELGARRGVRRSTYQGGPFVMRVSGRRDNDGGIAVKKTSLGAGAGRARVCTRVIWRDTPCR